MADRANIMHELQECVALDRPAVGRYLVQTFNTTNTGTLTDAQLQSVVEALHPKYQHPADIEMSFDVVDIAPTPEIPVPATVQAQVQAETTMPQAPTATASYVVQTFPGVPGVHVTRCASAQDALTHPLLRQGARPVTQPGDMAPFPEPILLAIVNKTRPGRTIDRFPSQQTAIDAAWAALPEAADIDGLAPLPIPDAAPNASPSAPEASPTATTAPEASPGKKTRSAKPIDYAPGTQLTPPKPNTKMEAFVGALQTGMATEESLSTLIFGADTKGSIRSWFSNMVKYTGYGAREREDGTIELLAPPVAVVVSQGDTSASTVNGHTAPAPALEWTGLTDAPAPPAPVSTGTAPETGESDDDWCMGDPADLDRPFAHMTPRQLMPFVQALTDLAVLISTNLDTARDLHRATDRCTSMLNSMRFHRDKE